MSVCPRPQKWLRPIGLLWLASLAACSQPAPPNVLVIAVDTLRADRLGAYGDARGLTPIVDSLADRGTTFQTAYAQSPWTRPSVASLMTSRFPSQHGVVAFESRLGAQETTLAEALRGRGYATAGFSANASISGKAGFAQGFDVYRAFGPVEHPERPFPTSRRAAVLNQLALTWVERRAVESPALLYVHYMEPHTPYAPPAEALARLFPDGDLPDVDAVNRAARRTWRPVSETMADDIRGLYDAQVMAVDAEIGALLRGLEERGFLDDAVIVFTADHGEELQDHGAFGHGVTLYEEIIRVPLVIVAPRAHLGLPWWAASPDLGSRSHAVVSLVDVAPTLLELAGVAAPAAFEGRSLVPLLRGEEAQRPGGPALAELTTSPFDAGDRSHAHHRALVHGDRKLIAGSGDQAVAFFDLAADPGERDSQSLDEAQRPGLIGVFEDLVERATRSAAESSHVPLDEEERRALEALGYLETEDVGSSSSKTDPAMRRTTRSLP